MTLPDIASQATQAAREFAATNKVNPSLAVRTVADLMRQSVKHEQKSIQNSRHYPIRILIARATPGSEFGQWEYEASSVAPGVSPDQFGSPDSPYYDAVFGPTVPSLTVCPLASIGQFVATQLANYHAPSVPQTLALADKLQRALPSLRVQLSNKRYVRRVIEYPVADTEGNVTEYRAEVEVWAPATPATVPPA